MELERYFEEMASSLQAQGVEVVRAGGSWRIADGDDVVKAVLSGADGDLVCHATVGNFANVSEKDLFLEDALRANSFWNETEGATLSVEPDTDNLVLADWREADFVDSAVGLEAFFARFFRTLRKWKRYLADCSPAGVPAVEERPEAADETPVFRLEDEVRFVP